jgi:pyrimidine operon attenuation protein/uracil phosphoribosyltransferase
LYNKISLNIGNEFPFGELDTTFFRDDFKLKPLIPQTTSIDFQIDNKRVILIDDVLYTGRSVRSALDALTHFGRPASVELLVLIDRRFRIRSSF